VNNGARFFIAMNVSNTSPTSTRITDAEKATIISKILMDWGDDMQARLERKARGQGLNFTGSLLNSFRTEVAQAQGLVENELNLYFAEQGRLRDMKMSYLGKMPRLDKMLEYVHKVGVDKFRYVPGYPLGFKPTGASGVGYAKGYTIAEQRIAYGISRSRMVKNPRAKEWFNKTFYSGLNELERQISNSIMEQLAATVKDIGN